MKPSNILYCLLAVCLLSGFPARGQTQPIESKYYYSSPQLGTHYETDTATMEEFVYYTVGDLDLTSQPGAPTLPVKYVRFSVPYNAANITVNASRDYTSLSRYGLRVYPVPQPIPTDGSVQGELPMVIDSTIYNTDAYWPASVAEMVSDGFYLGDNRVITVAVYPIQYNPKKTFLRFNSEIELTISYTLGATPGNILVRRDATLRQQEMNQVKTFVENPNSVESFSTEANIAQLAPVQGNPQPQTQYLIITTDSLAPAFERLAALKRQMGLTVKIKTVDEILADSISQAGDVFTISGIRDSVLGQQTFYDAPAKIRQFLRHSSQFENTQYVLMGGLDVPYRVAYPDSSSSLKYAVPTDLYYTDLTTEWKMYFKTGNLYFKNASPDIYVGRLLCTTQEQVNNYIDKLLRYTLNPGKGNPEYLQHALYTEGIDLLTKSEPTRNIFGTIMPYSTYVPEQKWNRYPKGADVIQELNNQNCGYISINNHGAPNNVTTYGLLYVNGELTVYDHKLYFIWALDNEPFGHDNHTQIESGNGLNNLNNKYTPAILYSVSCKVAPYGQMESPYNEHCSLSFAQSFTLGKDYGGPAFLGNSKNGYISISDKIQTFFADYIVHQSPKLGIAEAYSRCLANPLSSINPLNRYSAASLNLIGDPDLEMWTGIPSQYSGITINRQNTSISVNGIDTSTGETIVAVCGNDPTVRKVDTTDGNALFTDIDPNSSVMIYRHNKLPYIAPMVLQNKRIENNQHVIASSLTAGNSVDSNRTSGDVTIASGTNYSVEHTGTVSLMPGFKVEKGACFSVKPSDY